MPKLENLYSISPALFVTELEAEIADIAARQRQLEETVGTLRQLVEPILQEQVRQQAQASSYVRRWYYDARFPNYIIDNLYGLEIDQDKYKRWVGPERLLSFSLLLDRSVQYELEVNIVNFLRNDMKDGFLIMANDDELPWLTETATHFRAIIPQDDRMARGEYTRIGVGCRSDVAAPDPVGGDQRTLWFSLSSINIQTF